MHLTSITSHSGVENHYRNRPAATTLERSDLLSIASGCTTMLLFFKRFSLNFRLCLFYPAGHLVFRVITIRRGIGYRPPVIRANASHRRPSDFEKKKVSTACMEAPGRPLRLKPFAGWASRTQMEQVLSTPLISINTVAESSRSQQNDDVPGLPAMAVI